MAINEEAKKKISRIRSHKKVWYKVISPKVFGQKEIGETYLTAPQNAIGRTLRVNLKDLSGNVRDQNSYVEFRITKLTGTQLQSSVIGYDLVASYVKRMVRKNADRLDDYFAFTTKNDERVVVKTVMITMNKVHRSVQGSLRRQLQEALQEEISKSDFETFMVAVAAYKVQGNIKKRLAKIYPLKEVALRMIQLQEKVTDAAASETAVSQEQPLPEQSAEAPATE